MVKCKDGIWRDKEPIVEDIIEPELDVPVDMDRIDDYTISKRIIEDIKSHKDSITENDIIHIMNYLDTLIFNERLI